VRPLVFLLPSEGAHRVAASFLGMPLPWERIGEAVQDPALRVNVAGIEMANPVGMAAGFDKNLRFLDSLGRLGFGYVVGGTVTAQPRAGNEKPRIARFPRRESAINAMGFPNVGALAARDNLAVLPQTAPRLVSLSDSEIDDVLRSYDLLAPLADGIELNVSCPNVAWGKDEHAEEFLETVLRRLAEVRTSPVFVKIPPYRTDRERQAVFRLVRIAVDGGADALTASNTFPVASKTMAIGRGGLSGRAIFPDTVRIVGDLFRETEGRIPINACGGVFSAEDALACIRAGATTVQVYTGLIYQGPRIIRSITAGLAQALRQESAGLPLPALVGAGA
jgi:dihydroorotate dehydrogenase